jgi:O-antigen ligase
VAYQPGVIGAGTASGAPTSCVDLEMPQSLPRASFHIDRRTAAARAAGKARIMQLLPLLFVFYTFMTLPPEVQITIFTIKLPSYRIALLLVSVPALWSGLRNGVGRVQVMDAAIVIVGFWTMLSFTVNYGFEVGMVRGTGIFIDTVLPYFVARSCIKSLDDLRYFLILCIPALLFAAIVLTLESLGGRLFLGPAFASVFGAVDSYAGGEVARGSAAIQSEVRLGLLRAAGPFPHPILAGIMMIGFLPLYYFSGLRSWPFILGVMASLTGFFSLSSAAFLALISGVGVIVIYHVKAYIPKISWWTISAMIILLLSAAHIASKNGIVSVIARLTLTPHTALYRISIWDHGSVSVAKYPWFGIGYRQWERPAWMGESVDAHFLLLAMRHGLVVPIIMLAGVIFSLVRLGMIIPYLSPRDRTFCIGINICVVIFVLVGQTVNYFGSSNLLLMAVFAFLASSISWGEVQMQAGKRRMMAQYYRALAARAA